MYLHLVRPDDLKWGLEHAANHIVRIEKRTRGARTFVGIVDCVLRGQWQLWLVMDADFKCVAAFATGFYTRDDGKTGLEIEWLAGSGFREWRHLLAEVEDWARSLGCTYMHCLARNGVGREILKGYKALTTEFQKEL